MSGPENTDEFRRAFESSVGQLKPDSLSGGLPLPVAKQSPMAEQSPVAEQSHLPTEGGNSELVQFDIRSLFLLVTLSAVSIAVVVNFQLFGTVALFVVCGIASLMLRGYVKGQGVKRFWHQAMWGITMPLACIFTDPMVFREDGFLVDGEPGSWLKTFVDAPPWVLTCYAFMGWQMVLLFGSWFVSPRQVAANAYLAGGLLTGAIFAGAVALPLLPLTIIGSIFLIGLPGFTPWITMIVYGRTAIGCYRAASRDGWKTALAIGALGAVSTLLLAGASFLAAFEYGSYVYT